MSIELINIWWVLKWRTNLLRTLSFNHMNRQKIKTNSFHWSQLRWQLAIGQHKAGFSSHSPGQCVNSSLPPIYSVFSFSRKNHFFFWICLECAKTSRKIVKRKKNKFSTLWRAGGVKYRSVENSTLFFLFFFEHFPN